MVRGYLDQEGGGKVPLKPHQNQDGLAPLFLFFSSASYDHHVDLCHNKQTPERCSGCNSSRPPKEDENKQTLWTRRRANECRILFIFSSFGLDFFFFFCDISGGVCAYRRTQTPSEERHLVLCN